MVLPVTHWFGSGFGQNGSTSNIGAVLAFGSAGLAAAVAAPSAGAAAFSGALPQATTKPRATNGKSLTPTRLAVLSFIVFLLHATRFEAVNQGLRSLPANGIDLNLSSQPMPAHRQATPVGVSVGVSELEALLTELTSKDAVLLHPDTQSPAALVDPTSR